MFDLEIEGAPDVLLKINGALGDIDHFSKVELGQIMSAWQTDEMHRHRPFTMRWRGRLRKVQTVVRPHSLRELLGLREYYKEFRRQQHIKTGRLPKPKHVGVHRHWSTRPILRAALESRLFAEMIEGFHNAIGWTH